MNLPSILQPTFTGELRDIRLFTFSIDMDEAKLLVPAPLQPRCLRGRAIVSMADVRMVHLRPVGCPAPAGVNYRHIVLRMLIDDSRYGSGEQHGAYFLRSFVAQPSIAWAGNLFTEFNFHAATIGSGDGQLVVQCGEQSIRCKWEPTPAPACDEELRLAVQTLDKAYSVRNGKVFRRDVQRNHWLPVPLVCREFSCSWFGSVQFEGLFTITQPVLYRWFPPKEIVV